MASLNIFLAPATAILSSATITTSITSNTSSITSNTSSITAIRARRVQTYATASKGSSGSSEEKGFFEWLMGALDKDGLLEVDPILQKVEGKSSGTTSTSTGKKTTSAAAAPPKKSGGDGGFGGLGGFFAKK